MRSSSGTAGAGSSAWSAAVLAPRQVRALAAVSAPHPLLLTRSGQPKALTRSGWFQLPILPERRLLAHDGIHIERLLRAWAAPGGTFPDAEASRRYRAALQVWPAPHCALEYHRWFVRSRLRPDGRRYSAQMRTPVAVPVLQVHGAQDAAVSPSATTPPHLVTGPLRHELTHRRRPLPARGSTRPVQHPSPGLAEGHPPTGRTPVTPPTVPMTFQVPATFSIR